MFNKKEIYYDGVKDYYKIIENDGETIDFVKGKVVACNIVFESGNFLIATEEFKSRNYKLFKPAKIAVGQMFEIAYNIYYDDRINWNDSFKVRIDSIHSKKVHVVVCQSFWLPQYEFEVGKKTYFNLDAFENLADNKIISETPKCYYCLCRNNENYLDLIDHKFTCIACTTINV